MTREERVMEELRIVNGGLVESTSDLRFLAERTREVLASEAVLERRKARLQARLQRASRWLDQLRMAALLALAAGVAGLWPVALWVISGCSAAALGISLWRQSWEEALDRVQRRADLCRVELWHLKCREIYVPLPSRR
ncbi:hypothetical protein DYH09_00760 [bacterium CPR1]|nr:hypothetical protein [bacterium CPR1]